MMYGCLEKDEEMEAEGVENAAAMRVWHLRLSEGEGCQMTEERDGTTKGKE